MRRSHLIGIGIAALGVAAGVAVAPGAAWAGPTLPTLTLPGPGTVTSGFASQWQQYFAKQYAADGAKLNTTYSPGQAASNFASQWAALQQQGSQKLSAPTLPTLPPLSAPTLPTLAPLGQPTAATPTAPALPAGGVQAVLGALPGAMLSAPPSYTSIEQNPKYTAASGPAFIADAGGCGPSSSASCLGTVTAAGLRTALASAGLGNPQVALSPSQSLKSLTGSLPALSGVLAGSEGPAQVQQELATLQTHPAGTGPGSVFNSAGSSITHAISPQGIFGDVVHIGSEAGSLVTRLLTGL